MFVADIRHGDRGDIVRPGPHVCRGHDRVGRRAGCSRYHALSALANSTNRQQLVLTIASIFCT